MPKKPKLIEPIPATMQEIVRSFFANDPKPRDPGKEKEERKLQSSHVKAKLKFADKQFQTFNKKP